jgi:phage regulator Rha-like protein
MSGANISLVRQRADTRLMAQHLGIKHKNVFEMVKAHRDDFEQFGVVPFQTEKPNGAAGGRPERFALLNEDQAYLLLTFSRNTAKVRALKVKLVRAFSEARRAATIRQVEYLPSYHALHDAIKEAAHGAPNERWMHVNANKALNKIAGIEAGQRPQAGALTQSMLAVGSLLAAKAVQDARDLNEVQRRIKTALQPLEGALRLS